MNPEPRPSTDCGACSDYKTQGFQKCYCQCHIIGNLMIGYHYRFNTTPQKYKMKNRETGFFKRLAFSLKNFRTK